MSDKPKKRKPFFRRSRKKRDRKDEPAVVTVDEMEDMAKSMFDEADRKAGLDKRPGWKPRRV